jgi:heavy metal sensor kinase
MTISIRARLTLWYIAVLTLVLVAFSAGVFWLQARFTRAQFDDDLAALAKAVGAGLRAEFAERHDLARAAEETRENFNVPNRTIAILDGDGRPLAARWHGFHETNLLAVGTRPVVTTTLFQDGLPWRIRMEHMDTPDMPFIVFVGASENPILRERRLLARTLFVGMPIALFFSALVCWLVASHALQPVTDMSEQAERITLKSLDTRLSGDTANDEIGQLRRAFNRLLDRVAEGVQRQRQFMADASHELRTPVCAARTAAEVTLSRVHRQEDEYRDALDIVAAQTRRLARMVDDMLVLARADAGGFRVHLTVCRLDEVLHECADAVRVLADASEVVFTAHVQHEVVATCDDALVRHLVLNLLENAVKHTPEHGHISLTLRVVDGMAEIVVSDSGPGIGRSEDRERIFERFVRLDPARNGESGAGLGLPIARWIAEIHHGTLTLDDSGPSGSTFVARLPLTPGIELAPTTVQRDPADEFSMNDAHCGQFSRQVW